MNAMANRLALALIVLLAGCGSTVQKPSWPGLMAGQTIYMRLVDAQQEIQKGSWGNNKRAAQIAFDATNKAWEEYNQNPSIDTWNQVQAVGTKLDVTLRSLRGVSIGNPGSMPPCVTMKESWCKQPSGGN